MLFITWYQDGILGKLLADGQAGDGEDTGGDSFTLEQLLPHLGDNQTSSFFYLYPHIYCPV